MNRTTNALALGAAALLLPGLAACGSDSQSTSSSTSTATSTSTVAASAATSVQASTATSGQAGATASAGAASSAAGTTDATSRAAAPSSAVSVATTPVAPPSKGSITQTVAPKKVVTIAPVAVGGGTAAASASAGTAQVQVVGVKKQDVKATLPGDVSGPAAVVTVKVQNSGSKALNLSNVVVNLTGTGNTPGVPMSSAPSKPLSGSLAAGATAQGVYVFHIAAAKMSQVKVDVSVDPTLPVTTFTGSAQ